MLEWIPTPYGEMVPTFNGNLLASKVDPVKEARSWVAHHRRQVESARAHFILGVGAGHHIYELGQTYPDREFICFEYLENLSVSVLYSQIRTLTNVELLVGCDEKKIFKNERVQHALGNLFTIFVHVGSNQIKPEYYLHLRSALTARDWKSFNQVLKFRPPEDLFLNELNFAPKSQSLLSIKEINEFITESTVRQNIELNDAEMIWSALGELVR